MIGFSEKLHDLIFQVSAKRQNGLKFSTSTLPYFRTTHLLILFLFLFVQVFNAFLFSNFDTSHWMSVTEPLSLICPL